MMNKKNDKRISAKGELRVGTLLICFIMFLVFLTSALLLTGDFFSNDYYDAKLNTTFYGTLSSNRMDTNGENNAQLKNTIFSMSDDVLESNNSISSTNDATNSIDIASLKSLSNLKGTYIFTKNVMNDINTKLGLPAYFFQALLLIVIIIITLALISALRGTGKL